METSVLTRFYPAETRHEDVLLFGLGMLVKVFPASLNLAAYTCSQIVYLDCVFIPG